MYKKLESGLIYLYFVSKQPDVLVIYGVFFVFVLSVVEQ